MTKETKVESDEADQLSLKSSWLEIRKKQKVLMSWMITLFVASVVFLVVTLIVVHPSTSTVISGYGDVYRDIAGLTRGYRWEGWWNMLAFPIMAVMIGAIHNVIAVKIYQKYGKDLAIVFVVASLLIMLVALLAMFRVIGEW